jgi:hypothetical protein
MNTLKMKIVLALTAGAFAATAAVLTLPSAFAGATASYNQDIYKITVTPADASSGARNVPEWVSLTTGTWREDVENQSLISSDNSYVVIDNATGSVYHRSGPQSFMGGLHSAPEGVLALRAYLKGDPGLANRGLHQTVSHDSAGNTRLDVQDAAGKHVFSTTIDGQVSDQDAASAHLLDVSPAQPQVTDAEVTIGQPPTDGTVAYWFGRSVATWHAAAAAQHTRTRTPEQVAAGMSARGEAQVYDTLYEQPGVTATGIQPGQLKRPTGELQVTSEPLDSAHAQGLVNAFNGTNGDQTYPAWPHSAITLADGENAVVVPNQFDGTGPIVSGFFVITGSTLVSVSGDIAVGEISAMAAKLTPVG